MAAFRKTSSQRLSSDAERLVADALALAASGSRVEDRFWEERLQARLARLLKNGSQTAIDGALDHLFRHSMDGYDALIELAETLAESRRLDHEGAAFDVLLLAAPILAHTRYTIPSGPLHADLAPTLATHLRAHILADNVHLSLAPLLYSIDQLPRSHVETGALMQKLAQAALAGTIPKLDMRDLPETAPILADPRYVLGVVAVPAGQPLFRWQMEGSAHGERSACLDSWQQQVRPTIAHLLPGCEFELLLPDAFFVSCREADKRIRPWTVRAAVNYLKDTLNVQTEGLGAVVGAFGEERIEEYRVGFHLRNNRDIVYGIVWPLYDRETALADMPRETLDEADDPELRAPLQVIRDELRSGGIGDVFVHQELFDPESCEDCGAPLYADRSGELVHAEMPEDAPTQQPLFH